MSKQILRVSHALRIQRLSRCGNETLERPSGIIQVILCSVLLLVFNKYASKCWQENNNFKRHPSVLTQAFTCLRKRRTHSGKLESWACCFSCLTHGALRHYPYLVRRTEDVCFAAFPFSIASGSQLLCLLTPRCTDWAGMKLAKPHYCFGWQVIPLFEAQTYIPTSPCLRVSLPGKAESSSHLKTVSKRTLKQKCSQNEFESHTEDEGSHYHSFCSIQNGQLFK